MCNILYYTSAVEIYRIFGNLVQCGLLLPEKQNAL